MSRLHNLCGRLAMVATLAATATLTLAPSAVAAWESPREVDNQGESSTPTAPAAGGHDAVAAGANGLATAFFDQAPGGGGSANLYAIQRAASAPAWGAPQKIALPGARTPELPQQSVASDPAGNALGVFTNSSSILATSWPASATAPTASQVILTDPAAASNLAYGQVAFDSKGNGFAVAGIDQTESGITNGPIFYSSYNATTGVWSAAQKLTTTDLTEVDGRDTRLAVSPDGTVVIVYLKTGAGSLPNTTTATVYAIRRGSGAAGFAYEHQITQAGSTVSNSGETTQYAVSIDSSDTTTIADAEGSSNPGSSPAIWATRWAPGANPGGSTQIAAGGANPELAAEPSGGATLAWTVTGGAPGSATPLMASEFGAGSWTGAAVSGSGATVNGYSLAVDAAGVATVVWGDSSATTTSASARAPGKAWSAPTTLSAVTPVAGSTAVAATAANQADAVWVQSNGVRNAVYMSRFTGPPPPASGPPPSGGSITPPGGAPGRESRLGRDFIRGLHIAPATIVAAKTGASLAKAAVKTGGNVSYHGTYPALTTFTVQRMLAGRRSGGRCLPARGRAHDRTCARFLEVGTFTHVDAPGINRFHFTGRIGGRALAAGSYRLRAVPRNAAGRGRAISTLFRVKTR